MVSTKLQQIGGSRDTRNDKEVPKMSENKPTNGHYTRARLSWPRKTLYTFFETALHQLAIVSAPGRTHFTQPPPTRSPIPQVLDLPQASAPAIHAIHAKRQQTHLAILQHQFRPFPPPPLCFLISIHQHPETLEFSPYPSSCGRSHTLDFLEHEFEDVPWGLAFFDTVRCAE